LIHNSRPDTQEDYWLCRKLFITADGEDFENLRRAA